MVTISINGVTITTGSTQTSISVREGRVVVNGKDVTPEAKEITIAVHGDVGVLDVDACSKITVTGSAGSISMQSGDVECGDVAGGIRTLSGDVRCGAVAGSVESMSGDVTCTHVGGSASGMSGNVRGA